MLVGSSATFLINLVFYSFINQAGISACSLVVLFRLDLAETSLTRETFMLCCSLSPPTTALAKSAVISVAGLAGPKQEQNKNTMSGDDCLPASSMYSPIFLLRGAGVGSRMFLTPRTYSNKESTDQDINIFTNHK